MARLIGGVLYQNDGGIRVVNNISYECKWKREARNRITKQWWYRTSCGYRFAEYDGVSEVCPYCNGKLRFFMKNGKEIVR